MTMNNTQLLADAVSVYVDQDVTGDRVRVLS